MKCMYDNCQRFYGNSSLITDTFRNLEHYIFLHIHGLAHTAVCINTDQSQGVADMLIAFPACTAVSAAQKRVSNHTVTLLEFLSILFHNAKELMAEDQRSLCSRMSTKENADVRTTDAAVLYCDLHCSFYRLRLCHLTNFCLFRPCVD